MKSTTNFKLKKPEGTDPVDVQDLNDNADIIDAELAKKAEKTGAATDMVTAFSQASSRANLSSGEKLSASLGKIMKWFTDLKAVAWSGNYTDLTNRPALGVAASQGVANNLTTTAAGFALDARQGKALKDSVNVVNQNLVDAMNGSEWKLAGSANAKAEISLINYKYTEILFIVNYGVNCFTYCLPKLYLNDTLKNFICGGHQCDSASEIYSYRIDVSVSKNLIKIYDATRNFGSASKSNITSSCALTCYYK